MMGFCKVKSTTATWVFGYAVHLHWRWAIRNFDLMRECFLSWSDDHLAKVFSNTCRSTASSDFVVAVHQLFCRSRRLPATFCTLKANSFHTFCLRRLSLPQSQIYHKFWNYWHFLMSVINYGLKMEHLKYHVEFSSSQRPCKGRFAASPTISKVPLVPKSGFLVPLAQF